MGNKACKYPTWLEGHIKDWTNKKLTTVTLCSSSGNELLEVWYYGDLLNVGGKSQSYIVSTKTAPGRVVACDPQTGEKFLVFDYAKHGYNNMFCDTYGPENLVDRSLKRYNIVASKLILELGYGIDYEGEKEDYGIDENDMVKLVDGSQITWENVKRDGIDYIALFFVNEDGRKIQILDVELA